jgi:hypothetical protein
VSVFKNSIDVGAASYIAVVNRAVYGTQTAAVDAGSLSEKRKTASSSGYKNNNQNASKTRVTRPSFPDLIA